MLFRQVACLALVLLSLAASSLAAGSTTETISIGGFKRTYRLHVPPSLRDGQAQVVHGKSIHTVKPAPRGTVALVIAFHGSGADGAAMERLSKFSQLADSEGFIVVYPDAVGREWNDGREAPGILSQARHVNDVAFVNAMITQISRTHRIDPKRIYATGFSNGGIFAHYLGSKLANRLAAIAPVSGGLAEPAAREFNPASPLSVCVVHGAADKAVPYLGGEVDDHDNGRILATEDSVSLWVQQSGNAFAEPTSGVLSNTTADEHRRVKYTRWSAPSGNAEVLLYTIEDGGHAWPTNPQTPSVLNFWRSSKSFDTTRAIWDFFKSHPKA
jgi:polyhydroxybutyrate depolymerase